MKASFWPVGMTRSVATHPTWSKTGRKSQRRFDICRRIGIAIVVWLAAAEPCPIKPATSFRNEVGMFNQPRRFNHSTEWGQIDRNEVWLCVRPFFVVCGAVVPSGIHKTLGNKGYLTVLFVCVSNCKSIEAELMQ